MDRIFKKHKVKTVLDCGCGTGTHAILLAKKGYKVTAFDYSRNQIRIAKNKAKSHSARIDFRIGDITDFNFGRFDAVISLYSVLMFACRSRKDIDNAVKCMKKSLNPGGIGFFETSTPVLYSAGRIGMLEYESDKLKLARVRICEKTRVKNLFDVDYVYIKKERGKKPETFSARATNRLFTEQEITSCLKSNNLRIKKLYGSPKGSSYSPYSKDSFFISPLFSLA